MDLISRQAAIDGLKKIPDLTVYAYCSFFDMLMNMSSVQPEVAKDTNVSNNDCISRQAAIEAINSHFGFNIEEEYGSAVQEVINGLPSAQPERKKGEWQEREDYNGDPCYTCTCCGESWYTVSGNNPYDEGVNFCPNCGADMRE